MAIEDEKADFRRFVMGQHFANGEKVIQRFRHFLIVNPDETVVHPVINVSVSVARLALRNFVFVVRKLQIRAATVNIKMATQARFRHRGTFNVPTWAALSPG